MLKRRNKLIPDIVGHLPREISRFIWFFLTHGGKMEANVLSVRPLPSLIPSGGLEIMLMAKLTIDEKDAKILTQIQTQKFRHKKFWTLLFSDLSKIRN